MPPLGNGKQGVDHPLSRDHGFFGQQLLGVGTALPHRPLLQHGQFLLPAVGGADSGDGVHNGGLSLIQPFQSAGHPWWHHDFLHHRRGFLHCAQHVPGLQSLPHLGGGDKIPLFVPVQLGDGAAPKDSVPVPLVQPHQGPLNAVKDTFHQSGGQLHRQGLSGGFHRFPGAHPLGVLIDLHRGPVPPQFNDLPDEPLISHPHHFVHGKAGQSLGHNQGACYFFNLSYLFQFHPAPPSSVSSAKPAPMAFSRLAWAAFLPKPLLFPGSGMGTITG